MLSMFLWPQRIVLITTSFTRLQNGSGSWPLSRSQAHSSYTDHLLSWQSTIISWYWPRTTFEIGIICDLAAGRIVAKKLSVLIDGKVGEVDQGVAQILRLQTELLSCESEEEVKYEIPKYSLRVTWLNRLCKGKCAVFTSPICSRYETIRLFLLSFSS